MKTSLLKVVLAVCALHLSPTTFAATKTWDGSSSGLWITPANWSGGVAPVNGDLLVFPGGPTRSNTTNSAGGATNFAAISIIGSNYVLVSPPLSLTNGLTNVVTVLNATNTVRANLTPRTNQTWFVGNRNTLVLSSNVTIGNLTLTAEIDGTLIADGVFNGGAGSTLVKTGGGRLEANNTINVAQVNVNDGALQVDGQLGGGLTIASGAVLSGNGSVPPFLCSGIVSPGSSAIGQLTVSPGAAVFNAGSLVQLNLNGLAPGAQHDQLRVATPPNLSGAALSLIRNAVYTPVVGDKLVIITNTGGSAFTSTFANLPQNARITNNLSPATVFEISYTGGNGNDVELTVIEVAATPTGVIRVWDGDAAPNLNWTNATNWAANILPSTGDDLLFPATTLANRRSMDNSFTNGFTFNHLFFAGPANNWVLSGNSLKLLNGIVATNAPGARSFAFFNNIFDLAAAQTFAATNFSLLLEDEVRLNGHTLTVTCATNGAITFNGSVSGVGGFVMNGAGTLGLRASNSFSGAVTINSGQVDVDDFNTGPTAWQLNGGILRLISATIPGLQASSGSLQVGFENDATITGNLFLGAGATLNVRSLNPSSNGAPLVVNGNVTLGSATLSIEELSFEDLGQTFLLIRNDGAGPVGGTFAGLPEGTIFNVSTEEGNNFTVRISYIGGTGNDVTLELLTPTPTGVSRTWSGAGATNLWNDNGNWLDGIPLGGDSVLFPAGVGATTNLNIPPVILNRVMWSGSNYLQSGSLLLLNGPLAGHLSGTNIYIGGEIVTLGAQTWAVSNASATLRLAGRSNAPPFSLFPEWAGTGPITKSGAGTLELEGYRVNLAGTNFVIADGTLRLREAGFEDSELLLLTGRVDAAEFRAGTITALAGELLLSGDSESSPKSGVSAQNITLHSNATLTIRPPLNPFKESGAAMSSVALSLGGARLNFVPAGSETNGQVILLAHYQPGGLTNTFANLPEGAVTNVAGFGLQIHYAVTIPDSSGLFITLTVVSTPAPRFTQVQRLGSDVILRGMFLPNTSVFIEGTQDFLDWDPLGSTITTGAGIFTFIDSEDLPFRFYRAFSP